jgi:hypothetical protein
VSKSVYITILLLCWGQTRISLGRTTELRNVFAKTITVQDFGWSPEGRTRETWSILPSPCPNARRPRDICPVHFLLAARLLPAHDQPALEDPLASRAPPDSRVRTSFLFSRGVGDEGVRGVAWGDQAGPRLPAQRRPTPPAPPLPRASPVGRSLCRAPSQPLSQPALRGPTRASPVTHLCRANSSQLFPSHTLTPGSRWRRRRRRQRRRGTQTLGVSRSSGPNAGCGGPAPTRVLTRLALFRRRGHVLYGGPGAEGRGRRHGRRGPLGRRGRGRGREGRFGPGSQATPVGAGCGRGDRAPGAPPGPAGRGSRVSFGPEVPSAGRPCGQQGGSLSGRTLRRVVTAWAPALHRGSALWPGT